jgi:hypothetical protein
MVIVWTLWSRGLDKRQRQETLPRFYARKKLYLRVFESFEKKFVDENVLEIGYVKMIFLWIILSTLKSSFLNANLLVC